MPVDLAAVEFIADIIGQRDARLVGNINRALIGLSQAARSSRRMRCDLPVKTSPKRGAGGAGMANAYEYEDKGSSAAAVRALRDQQVGGIDKLKVPATDADIPVPKQPDGTVAYRYQTTEARRYLGKLLFHDPVRTARININTGQPVDLPAGTAFGGTLSATNPDVDKVVAATRQTGSCGSCHIAEAAGKAGQVLKPGGAAGARPGTAQAAAACRPSLHRSAGAHFQSGRPGVGLLGAHRLHAQPSCRPHEAGIRSAAVAGEKSGARFQPGRVARCGMG